jgi:hypothetical protein
LVHRGAVGSIWYADPALFAGINELKALALVLEAEGLPL